MLPSTMLLLLVLLNSFSFQNGEKVAVKIATDSSGVYISEITGPWFDTTEICGGTPPYFCI